MKKSLFGILLMAIVIPFMSSCASLHRSKLQDLIPKMFSIQRQPRQTFNDLVYGAQIKVVNTTPQLSSDKYIFQMSNSNVFVIPTVNYIRSIGFKEKDPVQDYVLIVTLDKIDVNTQYGNSEVKLKVQLLNSSGKEVYSQESMSSASDMYNVPKGLSEAFTKALEHVDWARVASFLRVEKLAKDEPTKQVEGLGTTALEQTIVRWEVNSRPQGADIFWRVVSKTPDVKSTNNKYLTTTPYEATKSLDIKGLTYQTAGDVRIILRCEKEGYYSQEKEFNARMVIDQEEISAFFRLVKEDE